MKEGYSSMNHKRLAAALLTALALTTLPAMGTAFAEDGVDAYGRPDAAARTQQENPPVTVSITPSDTQEPSENTAEETQEPAPQEEENNENSENADVAVSSISTSTSDKGESTVITIDVLPAKAEPEPVDNLVLAAMKEHEAKMAKEKESPAPVKDALYSLPTEANVNGKPAIIPAATADDVEPDYMKDDQRPIVGGESAPGGIKTPGVMTTAKDGRKKVTIKKSNKDKKNAAENLLDTLASFAKPVAGSQTADKEKKEK